MPDLDPSGSRLTQGADFVLTVDSDNEFDLVDGWLYSTLSNDPAIVAVVGDRVFAGGDPEGADWPYLWFDFVSAGDDIRTYGRSPVAPMTYHVELVDMAPNYDRISPAYARLRPLLDNGDYDGGDAGVIIACQRQRIHRMETDL